MSAGRTCPKCQSFDVREVTVQADDLHAYACHDCLHVFYLNVHGDLEDLPTDKGTRPKPAKRR